MFVLQETIGADNNVCEAGNCPTWLFVSLDDAQDYMYLEVMNSCEYDRIEEVSSPERADYEYNEGSAAWRYEYDFTKEEMSFVILDLDTVVDF